MVLFNNCGLSCKLIKNIKVTLLAYRNAVGSNSLYLNGKFPWHITSKETEIGRYVIIDHNFWVPI